MTLRLDSLYDIIVEVEDKIEDAKLRKRSVESEILTMESIYKILQNFGDLYDRITDEERKQLISHLIKEIQIYPEGESKCPLKSIKFNFPVSKEGKEVRELFLKSGPNVETIITYTRRFLPACEFLLVSTMLPNPDGKGNLANHRDCKQALENLVNEYEGVALADMTSMSDWLLERKEFQDMGDNLVHPTDFLSRIYAQVILNSLLVSD